MNFCLRCTGNFEMCKEDVVSVYVDMFLFVFAKYSL